MTILFLTTHFNTGGITRYILTLSRQLVLAGHRVCVVSSGGSAAELLERFGVRHIQMDILTKSVLSWKLYRAVPGLIRILREERVDLIHAHTRVTQAAACILSCMRGIPYVTTCHGFFRPGWFRRLVPCWGMKTVAVSPQVAEHLRHDFHVAEQGIAVIRNGIDLDSFFPDKTRQDLLKKKMGYSGKTVIGILARLSDVKGHAVLISAMPRIAEAFPQARLLIVGEGKEKDRLKARVSQLGLNRIVDFYPGGVQTEDFFCVFDCFVLPSLQEGLGLSVMEAQASGLAVIASRVGGIPSLIEDGITGILIEPNQPEALADAVIRVLHNPSLAAQLGMNARQKAEKEYGALQMAQKTLQVYEACCFRGPRALVENVKT